jgi:hypothetical protein
MTPKEKAEELFAKYYNRIDYNLSEEYSLLEKFVVKQCALIAVDEIIDSYTKEKSYGYIVSDKIIPYWEQVKQEIEKL